MTKHTYSLDEHIQALSTPEFRSALSQIRRGVEREALRINQNGTLAQTPHPPALGAAMTHDSITTDFSESLLEFITPPERQINNTIETLFDIHKFVHDNVGDEWLWPMSMPCFIENEDDIPIAYFGESNVGKMKQVYRIGLKNRYGSMMQAISGVHFNFSLSDSFWQLWAGLHGKTYSQDQVSEDYLSLIRNYRRLCWLIPYLYGASPSLCSSFLKGKPHGLDFKKIGRGTLYLPYATSLRMSDLGYTSAEQSSLRICYNSLDNYVSLLRGAMETPSERFSQYAAGEEGNYQQLSKNILQIENELYSPIRPKQPTLSMEKPTDALVRRGISYIEVRALDVDPFSPVGISETQCRFLDVFLLTCLLLPSELLDDKQITEANDNMRKVVLEGRDPALMLADNGQARAFRDWAGELFGHFQRVAKLLDDACGITHYCDAVAHEQHKIDSPALTPSGRIISTLLESNMDNGALGLKLARDYRDIFDAWQYLHHSEDEFKQAAEASLASQRKIESEDTKDFDTFIREYFAEPPAKKNA